MYIFSALVWKPLLNPSRTNSVLFRLHKPAGLLRFHVWHEVPCGLFAARWKIYRPVTTPRWLTNGWSFGLGIICDRSEVRIKASRQWKTRFLSCLALGESFLLHSEERNPLDQWNLNVKVTFAFKLLFERWIKNIYFLTSITNVRFSILQGWLLRILQIFASVTLCSASVAMKASSK